MTLRTGGDPWTAALTIGPDGGAALDHPGIRTIRVAEPDLLALDVWGSDELEELDLSACGPDLRVSVSGCPSLRRLHLPTEGPGASLHLDFGTHPPDLHISGAIAWADLCWDDEDPFGPGGSYDETHHGLGPIRGPSRRDPLRGLLVGRPATPVPEGTQSVILFAGRGPRDLELPPGVRELLVAGAPGVRTLRVGDGRAPLAVELRDLPELETLVLASELASARVEGAPRLRRVTGSGGLMHLQGSGDRLLELPAAWDLVSVIGSQTQELRARYAETVYLEGCDDLRIVVASPDGELVLHDPPGLRVIDGPRRIRLERVTVRQILENALGGTDFERDLALEWVTRRTRPSERVDALEVLHAAASRGWDPARLWQLRCDMHAASSARPRGRLDDGLTWSWLLPEDLAARGWEADLRLWRLCRDAAEACPFPAHAPHPRDFEAVLAESTEPAQLAAIAVTAAREHTAGRACADLVTLLGAALEAGRRAPVIGRIKLAAGAPGQRRQEAARASSFDRVRSVLQALVAMRSHPDAPALADSLASWIGKRMPYAQGLDLLGALRDLGCDEASAQLATFTADPDDEARKQHAMALLMKPPTHSAFGTAAIDQSDASHRQPRALPAPAPEENR